MQPVRRHHPCWDAPEQQRCRNHSYPQGDPRVLLDAAFGAQHEILIEIGASPTANHQALLQELGFTPLDGGQSWRMMSHSPLPELSARLEGAGIVAKEIRFRKPGLESLFVHLTQRILTLQKDDAA